MVRLSVKIRRPAPSPPPAAPAPVVPAHRRPELRKFSFINEHPEWAAIAHDALYLGDGSPGDLTYRVSVALKLAYDMGARGEAPPRPRALGERRIPEPEVDPELDPLYGHTREESWPDADVEPLSPREMKRRRMARAFEKHQQAAPRPRLPVRRTG